MIFLTSCHASHQEKLPMQESKRAATVFHWPIHESNRDILFKGDSIVELKQNLINRYYHLIELDPNNETFKLEGNVDPKNEEGGIESYVDAFLKAYERVRGGSITIIDNFLLNLIMTKVTI